MEAHGQAPHAQHRVQAPSRSGIPGRRDLAWLAKRHRRGDGSRRSESSTRTGSNSWAELAGLFCATRSAFLDHERAKTELKALIPEDAKEATGHGVRAKRSKSGAISFDLLDQRESHAAV